LATDLVAHKVSVIVALGTKAALAAHGATKTIPIVVAGLGDAVALGLSTNLGRPSSNVTGWVNVAPELYVKLLEDIKDTAPRVTHVAYLVNPANPPTHVPEIRSTAASLKIRLTLFEARTARELEPVFGRIAASQCDAILLQGDTLFGVNARAVTDLALRHRLVSASSLTGFADAGGLVFYGPDRLEGYRRAAYFVDKLLQGAKPGDLPMEQPTKFEFVANLKTAKSLAITIPQSVLQRADRVIE
jgi:putative ABC transport system substrate-binding protein